MGKIHTKFPSKKSDRRRLRRRKRVKYVEHVSQRVEKEIGENVGEDGEDLYIGRCVVRYDYDDYMRWGLFGVAR